MAFLDLCFSGCSPWTACRPPFLLAAPPASFLTRTPGFAARKRSRLERQPAAPLAPSQLHRETCRCSNKALLVLEGGELGL